MVRIHYSSSPDSRHVAYNAQQIAFLATIGGIPQRKWVTGMDGNSGPEYDGLLKGSALVFDGPSTVHVLALRGGNSFVLIELSIAKIP
jgi:hypothetical protein